MYFPVLSKAHVKAIGPIVNVTVWPTVMFKADGKKPLYDPMTVIAPLRPGTHPLSPFK